MRMRMSDEIDDDEWEDDENDGMRMRVWENDNDWMRRWEWEDEICEWEWLNEMRIWEKEYVCQ